MLHATAVFVCTCINFHLLYKSAEVLFSRPSSYDYAILTKYIKIMLLDCPVAVYGLIFVRLVQYTYLT